MVDESQLFHSVEIVDLYFRGDQAEIPVDEKHMHEGHKFKSDVHQVREVAEKDVQGAHVEFKCRFFLGDTRGKLPDAGVLEDEAFNHRENNRDDEDDCEVHDSQDVELVLEVVAVPGFFFIPEAKDAKLAFLLPARGQHAVIADVEHEAKDASIAILRVIDHAASQDDVLHLDVEG
jgi:hypothetical protein